MVLGFVPSGKRDLRLVAGEGAIGRVVELTEL